MTDAEYSEWMASRQKPTAPTKHPTPENFTKVPKILIIDIETLYAKGEFWHTGKQRINYQQITQESCLLSWAGKWLYDSEIFGDVLTSEEAKARDDSRIAKSAWKMLEDADILIGHNIVDFDIRFLNGRFWRNHIQPPTPFKTIDTLQAYRKAMRLLSYRLDYISKLIQRKGKLETDYELWQRCDKGEQEALDYMYKYNREDVLLGEEAYDEVKGFVKNHPNLYIIGESDQKCCTTCGSTNLQETNSFYVTPAGRFRVIRCEHGHLNRERISDLTREDKTNLLLSVAQ
jgi:DNA polymerase elongation subunit (family B)